MSKQQQIWILQIYSKTPGIYIPILHYQGDHVVSRLQYVWFFLIKHAWKERTVTKLWHAKHSWKSISSESSNGSVVWTISISAFKWVDCSVPGTVYIGNTNVAWRGKPCLQWDLSCFNDYIDVETAAGNFCRSYNWSTPWCHVEIDGDWEECNIPTCCKYTLYIKIHYNSSC